MIYEASQSILRRLIQSAGFACNDGDRGREHLSDLLDIYANKPGETYAQAVAYRQFAEWLRAEIGQWKPSREAVGV